MPPRQVYFAGRLAAATKRLHDELGNGYLGNLKENVGLCSDRKCYERSRTLQARALPLINDPAFKGWDHNDVDALPDSVSEHTAACYWYRPDRHTEVPVVELVADAWDDAFLPADAWFAVHDEAAGRALATGGKGFCGAPLRALRKAALDRQVEAEQRDEVRARKLKELGRNFSQFQVPF